jgi:anti-anti-sigma factor
VAANERSISVVLTGDLDISRRQEIESQLPDVNSADRVVIDCSAATSIDSSILTVLMRYRRRFQQSGKDPLDMIVIASAGIRRMFEVAGLSKLVTVISAPSEPAP